MRMPSVIIGGVVAAFLGACTTVAPQSAQSSIAVARQVTLNLPASSELTLTVDATQLLTIDYGRERHMLQAHVELRPGKVVLVVMDILGAFLFSIKYDREIIVIDTMEGWPQTFPLEPVLADFLLAYLPWELVSSNLSGGHFERSTDDRIRRVLRHSQAVMEIRRSHTEPWLGAVEIAHLERGYLMTVETVSYSSE